MSKTKYGIRIRKEADGFVAEVIRRKTSKGTTVHRRQRGFPTQSDAEQWASSAFAEYLLARNDRAAAKSAREKRRREQRRLRENWLRSQSLRQLAEAFLSGGPYSEFAGAELKHRAESLWSEVVFCVIRNGAHEHEAFRVAGETVGKQWEHLLENALAGKLDEVAKEMDAIALARARLILKLGQTEFAGDTPNNRLIRKDLH